MLDQLKTYSTTWLLIITMACIQDAYSNHGWVSAWAFVQTAFIPATAAGIAAACALKNI